MTVKEIYETFRYATEGNNFTVRVKDINTGHVRVVSTAAKYNEKTDKHDIYDDVFEWQFIRFDSIQFVKNIYNQDIFTFTLLVKPNEQEIKTNE